MSPHLGVGMYIHAFPRMKILKSIGWIKDYIPLGGGHHLFQGAVVSYAFVLSTFAFSQVKCVQSLSEYKATKQTSLSESPVLCLCRKAKVSHIDITQRMHVGLLQKDVKIACSIRFFSLGRDKKYADQSKLMKKMFLLFHSSRVRSVMVGNQK